MSKLRQIRKRCELPKWFSLNNYHYINSISDKELLLELRGRWGLWYVIEATRDKDKFRKILDNCQDPSLNTIQDSKALSDFLHASLNAGNWETIKQSGRCHHSDDWRRKAMLREPKSEYVEKIIHNFEQERLRKANRLGGGLAVKPLSISDVRCHAEKLDAMTDQLHDKHSSYSLIASDPEHIENKVSLSVDLSLPDVSIIAQLKKLLPQWRESLSDQGLHAKKPKKATPAVFDRIRTYMVIPYLDLSIWADEVGVTIRHSLIDTVLFDGGREGQGDRFVKTTLVPFCEELMEYKFLADLDISFCRF